MWKVCGKYVETWLRNNEQRKHWKMDNASNQPKGCLTVFSVCIYGGVDLCACVSECAHAYVSGNVHVHRRRAQIPLTSVTKHELADNDD